MYLFGRSDSVSFVEPFLLVAISAFKASSDMTISWRKGDVQRTCSTSSGEDVVRKEQSLPTIRVAVARRNPRHRHRL